MNEMELFLDYYKKFLSRLTSASFLCHFSSPCRAASIEALKCSSSRRIAISLVSPVFWCAISIDRVDCAAVTSVNDSNSCCVSSNDRDALVNVFRDFWNVHYVLAVIFCDSPVNGDPCDVIHDRECVIDALYGLFGRVIGCDVHADVCSRLWIDCVYPSICCGICVDLSQAAPADCFPRALSPHFAACCAL